MYAGTMEMATDSPMQNMVQVRQEKALRDQIIFLAFWKKGIGALGVESPHGGAMRMHKSIMRTDRDSIRRTPCENQRSNRKKTPKSLKPHSKAKNIGMTPRAPSSPSPKHVLKHFMM